MPADDVAPPELDDELGEPPEPVDALVVAADADELSWLDEEAPDASLPDDEADETLPDVDAELVCRPPDDADDDEVKLEPPAGSCPSMQTSRASSHYHPS
ncbi:MAG: hypothetical protein AB2A00_08750 [Myxococcota bacterium]